MRFKKPVPIDTPVRVVGRIVKEGSRFFEGTGEILLEDGTVAVEGQGRYIKMPLSKIADFDVEAQEWKIVAAPDDPREVDVVATGRAGVLDAMSPMAATAHGTIRSGALVRSRLPSSP